MLKNVIQPLITDTITNTITQASAALGDGFMMNSVGTSLIDSITITSGTVNIYGNIYSGYGQGVSSYHGSKSPSTIDLADGVEHTVEALRQHNNKVEFTLGANSSQYLATLNPAGGVTNSDADSFKTIKFYNTSSDTLVLTLERADIPYSPYSKYGYFDGSGQSLVYPRWKQTSAEAGDYFANQTIRVELWS
jgi:hypothetical protein